MKPRRSYLLAHGKQDGKTLNVPFVTFTPACANEDIGIFENAGPFIGIYEGFFPYDPGGEARPSSVLEREALMNILAQLDLAWFIPYVERMARGEQVGLEEIDAAYRARHGRGMESSPVPPFRFSFMDGKKESHEHA